MGAFAEQAITNPMMKMHVPSDITVNLEMSEYRKYKLNVAKAFLDQGLYVLPKYKKKLRGRVSYKSSNGTIVTGAAELRITGDITDHIRIRDVVSSLHVKLIDEHISGITRFKLLLPGTRFGYHEIFATTLFEQLGILSPY